MQDKLVLYTKGNVKQFDNVYNRKEYVLINTKYRGIEDIRGLRFTEVIINDRGVSGKDIGYANRLGVK